MALKSVLSQNRLQSINTSCLRFALAATVLLLLGGCVSTPSQLQAPVSAPDIKQVRADAEANLNKSVRWGGIVAGVQNLDGQTRIELIAKPLLRNGEPDSRQVSQGRFVAVFDEFLDPSDYKKNSTLTVVGVVTGTELGKVGEAEYDFPRLQATAHQLWSSENTRFARRAEYGYANSHYGVWPYGYSHHGRYGFSHGRHHHRHSPFYDWWIPGLFFNYSHHRGSRLHISIGN